MERGERAVYVSRARGFIAPDLATGPRDVLVQRAAHRLRQHGGIVQAGPDP